MNGVQDQYIRAAGILNADLSTELLGPKKLATVVHLTASSAYTFSGLDGNADYGYDITLMGQHNTTATHHFEIKPNSLTTGFGSTEHYWNDAAANGVVNNTATGFRLKTNSYAVNHTTVSRMTLTARTGMVSRVMLGQCIIHHAGARHSDNTMSTWNDNTTNITSLLFDFNVSPGTAGTFTGVVILRKLAEA